jgi:hypothetical protein
MALFNITTSGEREARAMFTDAKARMKNTLVMRKRFGEEMLVRNRRRLSSGVDIDNEAFKPSRRAAMFGGTTMFDSAALARSIHYDTPANDLDLFSTNKAARVHWLGLTIRPVHGSFLTIPLRARGGLFASAAVDVVANRTGRRASHYAAASTFIKRFGNHAFIMQKVGAHSLRALFILLSEVKMPQRRWFGFGGDDLTLAAERLGDYVVGEKTK